jgi:hypothetical protein
MIETGYLVLHAITTIGAIVIFLIRTEHRITRAETILTLLKEQHDRYADRYHKTID